MRLRDSHGELVYGVNATGMVSMDYSWFVNHSETPNLTFARVPGEDFNQFRTTRAVQAGEELTYDYSVFAPDMHARIVSSAEGSVSERRKRLEHGLSAAQASVDQLRQELEALDRGL